MTATWCADPDCGHPMPYATCIRCGGTETSTVWVDKGDPDGRRHGTELYDDVAFEVLVGDMGIGSAVCIAHGRFAPCRKEGGHRYTSNPYWVKSVLDYQTSTAEGLTWEPAWEAGA